METPRIFWTEHAYIKEVEDLFRKKATILGVQVTPSRTFGDDPGITTDHFTNRCIYDKDIVDWELPKFLSPSYLIKTENIVKFKTDPHLPVVAKASVHKGRGKYLLETSSQLIRFFYEYIKNFACEAQKNKVSKYQSFNI